MNQLLVDFEYLMKVMFRSHKDQEGSRPPQRWREAQGMLRKLEEMECWDTLWLSKCLLKCRQLWSTRFVLPHRCLVPMPTEQRDKTGSRALLHVLHCECWQPSSRSGFLCEPWGRGRGVPTSVPWELGNSVCREDMERHFIFHCSVQKANSSRTCIPCVSTTAYPPRMQIINQSAHKVNAGKECVPATERP